MAVDMSSFPLQEPVSFEQKVQPVPSEMALDLNINGTTSHDDASRDQFPVQKPIISSFESASDPSAALDVTEANGIANGDSFRANNTFTDDIDVVDAPVTMELEIKETVSISSGNADAPESTASTVATTLTCQEPLAPTNSSPPSESEQELMDATEPPPSLIPPIIEAQESDLREEVIPATEQEAENARTEKHTLDLSADPELATEAEGLPTPQPHLEAELDNLDESELSPHNTSHNASVDEHPLHPASVSNLDLNNSQLAMASVPDLPQSLQTSQSDTEMLDAPPSPSKVAREREEDSEDGPSAKRTKVATGEDKMDTSDVATSQNGEDASDVPVEDESAPPTKHQIDVISKALRHYKSTTHGKNFKAPVVSLWPLLGESYTAKISHPVDLGTMDEKLRNNGYASMADLKVDINRLYENCVIYNGPDHGVTRSAEITRTYLLSKIPDREPPKVEKKAKKETPKPETLPRARGSSARRQSRGANTAGSPPAQAARPSQTFALAPTGTPVIRRDSTKTDGGRPKREIHPPKSKDLVYNAQRPKKRKFAAELKFAEDVLNEIRKPKFAAESSPFAIPVDTIALGIPDYYNVIKKPMDLQTVAHNLKAGQYENARAFELDIRQIFKNCYTYNPSGSPVYLIGKSFEAIFDREWSKKAQYLAEHASSAASPVTPGDTEEEDSEEEDIEEEPVSNSIGTHAARLILEQNKLIELMMEPKGKEADIDLQKKVVAMIKGEAETEASASKSKSKKAKNASKPNKTKGRVHPPAAQSKKTADKKKGGYKLKHIGIAEKEEISNGIAALSGSEMDQAIALLKVDFPNLNIEGEVEFDIEQFSALTLSKLHDLIARTHPEQIHTTQPVARAPKPSGGRKKNKPMGKNEQESKIAKLKQLQDEFMRNGSTSDDAKVIPTVEQDQSSGDEESSDSEED